MGAFDFECDRLPLLRNSSLKTMTQAVPLDSSAPSEPLASPEPLAPAEPSEATMRKLSDLGSAYGYQRRDAEIVDYKIWKLWTPKTGFALRGPRPVSLAPGDYCTSLGAASTFGRFVKRPYPQLLGEALGISSLNLGFSGIGPSFYNDPKNDMLINVINRSKFVTIAVMSGRSQSNSRFKTAPYSQEQYILEDGQVVPADFAYQQLIETADTKTIVDLVAETRMRYLRSFLQLLDKITVPKVLVWFSGRSPNYQASYENLFKLLSGFPHMVDLPMVKTLKRRCNAYIEIVSSNGLPQPLMSRHTGKPVSIVRPRNYQQGKIQLTDSSLTHNHYYPSPEMHQSLTQSLIPICKQLLHL